MSSNQTTPDLSSILRTLSQHSGHPAPPKTVPSAPAPAPGPQPIDPSRITTYPPALRYTTSLLASNPGLTLRIKKLIRSQNEHERMWWSGRSSVPAERAKKMEGRKAVNDVLRALGGKVAEGGEGGVATEDEAFAEFDAKVHAASLEMEKDHRRQLKEMGIPGFVIRGELVGEGLGKVSREQVRELEKRMVGLLEDLCKD